MSYVALWLVVIGFILIIIGAVLYAIYKTFSTAVWILLGLGLLIFLIGLVWWLVTYSYADTTCVKPKCRKPKRVQCAPVKPVIPQCVPMQNESVLCGIDYDTNMPCRTPRRVASCAKGI